MSRLTPANLSRAIGFGRIGFGLALIVLPARIGERWLGKDATTPAASVALRGLGIRDALIGMAQVHTAGDPDRGYRWARTAGFADVTDLAATAAVARSLPGNGLGGAVVAGGAAVLSFITSKRMQADA